MTPLKIMITIIPLLLAVSNTQNVDPYSNFFAMQCKLANPQAPQTFQIGYWRLTNKKGHQIRNFTPSEKKTAFGNNFAESTGWASVQGSHIEEYYKNWIIDTLQHNDRDFESLNGLKSYCSLRHAHY